MRFVTAGNIVARGEAFGIPSTIVDGMDVLAVFHATVTAVDHARTENGPSFLVFQTYRHSGHGMSDVDRTYRTREEEQEWRQRDPIDRLGKSLIAIGHVTQNDLDSITATVRDTIDASVEIAWNSAFPDPEEVTRHVYAD